MVNETISGQIGGVTQGATSFVDMILDVLRNIHQVLIGFSPENAFFINLALSAGTAFLAYKYLSMNKWIYVLVGGLALLVFSLL